jgi:hypothetical protein
MKAALLVLCSCATMGFAQLSAVSGAATTRGTCSPANSGNNNTFTINCGIGKDQGDKMLAILNRILSSQIDPDTVMTKLDEIQKGVNAIREQSLPRMITDENAAKVTAFLKQFPKQKVTMAFLSANEESRKLAEKIRSIILAAGWDCEAPGPMMPFATGPLPGIEIRAKTGTPAATGLLNAIHQIGLDVSGSLTPTMEDNVISLSVFAKP